MYYIIKLVSIKLLSHLYLAIVLSFAILPFLYFTLTADQKLSFIPTLKAEKPRIPDLSTVFKRESQELKEDKLSNITLLATASGSINMALVKINEETKTVRVGTQIGNYRVSKIERNYIVLSKDQERKAVGFSFSKEGETEDYRPSTQPSASSLQSVIQKRDIESVTADPGMMFRQIRLVPYVQEGRTVGFLFEWIDPQSIFSKVGIQPGDVLVSINNQSIRSGEDAFRILQVLRNESSFKINLIREGKSIEILVRIE